MKLSKQAISELPCTAVSWENFVQFRKDIKKPLTERSIAMAINKIKQMDSDGYDTDRVIADSILNQWQGLFAKEQHKKPKAQKLWKTPDYMKVNVEVVEGKTKIDILVDKGLRPRNLMNPGDWEPKQ